MSPSMLLSLFLAATGFERVEATGGRPELVMIHAETSTVSMLISFRVGSADDGAALGATAQTMAAMTEANAALPLRRWLDSAFAANARLSSSVGLHQTTFVLTAPAPEFLALAQPLAAALMRPQLSRSAFTALKGRVARAAHPADELQYLMTWIEPMVLRGGTTPEEREPEWRSFSELDAHRQTFFVPANATVTVMGDFDPTALRKLFSASGGTRRIYPHLPSVPGVKRAFSSRLKLHVIGYPLEASAPVEAAAVRVIRRLLYNELTQKLREDGVAYTVEVTPVLGSGFNGLLLLVPTFDDSGIDLEPFVLGRVTSALRRPLTQKEVQPLVAAELNENEMSTIDPPTFIAQVVAGRAAVDWLSPEQSSALAGLTAEELNATAARLFSDERQRFYLKFGAPR